MYNTHNSFVCSSWCRRCPYLTLLAMTDYIYKECFDKLIITWQGHYLCNILGSFSFVSCQVSLFMLLLISIKRAKSTMILQKVERNDRQLNILSLCVWTTAVVIAVILFLFVALTGQFQIHNNLCLYFGITGNILLQVSETVSHTIFIIINVACLIAIIAANILLLCTSNCLQIRKDGHFILC